MRSSRDISDIPVMQSLSPVSAVSGFNHSNGRNCHRSSWFFRHPNVPLWHIIASDANGTTTYGITGGTVASGMSTLAAHSSQLPQPLALTPTHHHLRRLKHSVLVPLLSPSLFQSAMGLQPQPPLTPSTSLGPMITPSSPLAPPAPAQKTLLLSQAHCLPPMLKA